MPSLLGRCLCGKIEYTVAQPPLQVVACHCAMCRRMTGSPFSVYLVVREKDLTMTRGEDASATHQVTQRTTRTFCGTCGSPLFNLNPVTYPGLAMLYLGSTDRPHHHPPVLEIFCESKLEWANVGTPTKAFARSPREVEHPGPGEAQRQAVSNEAMG